VRAVATTAKKDSSSAAVAKAAITPEVAKDLYYDMLLGREFEEMCAQMYYRGKMFGFVHLYSGQEAVSSGAGSEGGTSRGTELYRWSSPPGPCHLRMISRLPVLWLIGRVADFQQPLVLFCLCRRRGAAAAKLCSPQLLLYVQWRPSYTCLLCVVCLLLQVSSGHCAPMTMCAPPTVTTCTPCPRVCLPAR
jgi:hypothetical protein